MVKFNAFLGKFIQFNVISWRRVVCCFVQGETRLRFYVVKWLQGIYLTRTKDLSQRIYKSWFDSRDNIALVPNLILLKTAENFYISIQQYILILFLPLSSLRIFNLYS